jgi:hypothetical protein
MAKMEARIQGPSGTDISQLRGTCYADVADIMEEIEVGKFQESFLRDSSTKSPHPPKLYIILIKRIATSASGGRSNAMEIRHVKDAETSSSNVNTLQIVVPMASRIRTSSNR